MLRAIRERRVEVVASWALADEIARVLRSPKLARYRIGDQEVGDALELLAPFLPYVDVRVELRDPNDAPVVAAALAGAAEAIVTGDTDFLEDRSLIRWLAERGISVMKPVDFLAALER